MSQKRTVFIIAAFFMFALLMSACTLESAPHPWDSDLFENIGTPLEFTQDTPHGHLAIQYLTYMNDYLPARLPFSCQEKEAAVWIAQMLLAMGYTWDDIRVQQFVNDWDDISEWVQVRGKQPRNYSQNVILTVPGQSEQIIVVGAHYDSTIQSQFYSSQCHPGASDNASGTALLLESAQRMRYIDNYYTIVYIFFGAHEVGMIGGLYYVDALSEAEQDNILMMINADALLEGSYLMYQVNFNEEYRPSSSAIVDAWHDMVKALYDLHGIELIHFRGDGIGILPSDQTSFYEVGIPVVIFIGLDRHERGFLPRGTNHTPRDCLHYINENWPGKVDRAMLAYSLLLEAMLLHRYE